MKTSTPVNAKEISLSDIIQMATDSLEGLTIPQLIALNISLEKLKEKARLMKIKKAKEANLRL